MPPSDASSHIGEQATIWSFGFGSNMDVEALRAKKGIRVLDHVAAIVHGWRMSFSIRGPPLVEPAFAVATPGGADDEIHGVAFCMPEADVPLLDNVERGYAKADISFEAYDGRTLLGYLYTTTTKPGQAVQEEGRPSKRYLGVLMKGGRQACLNEAYLERLSKTPTYSPSDHVLQARRSLPDPAALPGITVDELLAVGDEGDFAHVAILGYVLRLPRSKVFFGSHKGRDITARQLRQARGLPLDADDDMGRPPFPKIADMTPDEEEFVRMWLDHYFVNAGGSDLACIVGFLTEFRLQLEAEG